MCARNSGRLLWALPAEGALTLVGRQDLTLEKPGLRLPVCNRAWLFAETRCTLSLSTTEELISSKTAIWPDLESFHGLIRNAVIRDRTQADDEESKDYDTHKEAEERLKEATVGRLSSVLTTEPDLLAETFETPLLAACMLVGKALGIRVLPRSSKAAGHLEHDPVQRIAEESGFRVREVLLADDWWRRDNGPLLGFMDKDERPVALLPASPGKYMLVDPGSKERVPVNADVAPKLSPIAYMFYAPFPDRTLSPRDLLKFGLMWVRKDLRMMALMGVCVGLVSILVPIATQYLYDHVIPS
ncbi:hypothetical protein ACFL2Q_01760 [Thermodesulfobacteriota bacterium]